MGWITTPARLTLEVYHRYLSERVILLQDIDRKLESLFASIPQSSSAHGGSFPTLTSTLIRFGMLSANCRTQRSYSSSVTDDSL
jgi:hypothetical protein